MISEQELLEASKLMAEQAQKGVSRDALAQELREAGYEKEVIQAILDTIFESLPVEPVKNTSEKVEAGLQEGKAFLEHETDMRVTQEKSEQRVTEPAESEKENVKNEISEKEQVMNATPMNALPEENEMHSFPDEKKRDAIPVKENENAEPIQKITMQETYDNAQKVFQDTAEEKEMHEEQSFITIEEHEKTDNPALNVLKEKILAGHTSVDEKPEKEFAEKSLFTIQEESPIAQPASLAGDFQELESLEDAKEPLPEKLIHLTPRKPVQKVPEKHATPVAPPVQKMQTPNPETLLKKQEPEKKKGLLASLTGLFKKKQA
jgi:hypothetical protein